MQPFVSKVGEKSLVDSLRLHQNRYLVSGIEQKFAVARNDFCVGPRARFPYEECICVVIGFGRVAAEQV